MVTESDNFSFGMLVDHQVTSCSSMCVKSSAMFPEIVLLEISLLLCALSR